MKIPNIGQLSFVGLGLLISLSGYYLTVETRSSAKNKSDRDKTTVAQIETVISHNKSKSIRGKQAPSFDDTSSSTNKKLQHQIATYLNRLRKTKFSGTVLVAQNGKIIFNEGYGLANVKNNTPNTSATVFDLGSLSKQFTAAAILHLEQQGKLKVTDRLEQFFDNVPAEKADITIHQLLTHSSGLPDYVYEDDLAQTNREKAIALAFDAELEFKPGKEYLYSDTGYGLLAAITEIASNKSFQDYLKQHLFKPAGMNHTGFYNDSQWRSMNVAHGYNNGKDFGSAATRLGPYWGLLGFGGVLTTAKDMYLWNIALENNLVLDDKLTVRLFTPHIKENSEGDSYYGYGWTIEKNLLYGKKIWHDGATDSYNSIMLKYNDPNDTLVIVLANRIDKSLLGKETFYGTNTGLALGNSILKRDFDKLPDYAR